MFDLLTMVESEEEFPKLLLLRESIGKTSLFVKKLFTSGSALFLVHALREDKQDAFWSDC